MKQLKINYTSDMHGFMPEMLEIAKELTKDENTINIDCGDSTAGSSFTRFLIHEDEHLSYNQHMIATAMNIGKYDYITLGNHDFNFGLHPLKIYLENIRAECICANVTWENAPIKKWEIITLTNGLKIGITGIVTDFINVWEKPENIKGITISPPYEAVKLAFNEIKDKCDFTICIYHGGFEGDIQTGQILLYNGENIGLEICNTLDFDLLLTGHQHNLIESHKIKNTHIVQPGAYGTNYIIIDVIFENGEKPKITSKLHKPEKIENIKEFFENIKIESKKSNISDNIVLLERLEKTLMREKDWLEEPIGTIEKELLPDDKLKMALYGSNIADFFNKIQINATNAQISVTSLANNISGFTKDVSIKDVMNNYPYMNHLVILEIDYHSLKSVIEQSLSYFLMIDGEITINPRFTTPKSEHYNFDYFYGIEIEYNLNEPIGNRVISIKKDGKELNENEKYTLTTNNYRATGTGGYDAYKSCKLIKEYKEDVTDLIIEYIKKKPNC
ncbi:MAG: 5'-nucleotidase C-terminal domain-containing protein [Defluviitaleaceae bacterium]|nr:5'-nucleotidase C-terminal domain-containing protein [Defluviitaleaceae bacterium]